MTPVYMPNGTRVRASTLRLLEADGRLDGRLTAVRQWAVYISLEPNPTGFASAVLARGLDWRPVVVNPERAPAALKAIQPALVVIDCRLPDQQLIAQMAQRGTSAVVISCVRLAA